MRLRSTGWSAVVNKESDDIDNKSDSTLSATSSNSPRQFQHQGQQRNQQNNDYGTLVQQDTPPKLGLSFSGKHFFFFFLCLNFLELFLTFFILGLNFFLGLNISFDHLERSTHFLCFFSSN